MIFIDHHPKAGKENGDVHPLLVLSPRAFNERTGIVIGLPMTHSAMNEDNPFAIKFEDDKGVVCYVLAHQPKSFDWRIRGARPHSWGQAPQEVFDQSLDTLAQIVGIAN